MHHFTASDGARIAYADDGDGRPLVLLHGLMAHGGFFRRQQELSDDFRLISIDLRGHGSSRAPGQRPTVERLAGDVAELVAHLDLRDAIGIGWSLGASVLWHVLTGPASSRFAGAVIVDMTPRVLNDGDWSLGLSEEVCDARAAAIRDDFADFAVTAVGAIFAQPLDAEGQETAAWAGAEFARNEGAAIGALWASLVGQDLRPRLPAITQPTLVIHGAQSRLYGSDTADYLAAALPDAATIRFDRSGHAPHMEEPDRFNRAIRDFAARLPRVREPQASF